MTSDGNRTTLVSRSDVLVALLAGIAGVCGSYLSAGLTPSFLAGAIAGGVSKMMPGMIVTGAILFLGEFAKALLFGVAVGVATTLLTIAALFGRIAGRWMERSFVDAFVAALVGWVVTAQVTAAPVESGGASFGIGVSLLAAEIARSPRLDGTVSPDRRRVLGGLVSTAAFGVVSVFLRGRSDITPNLATESSSPADSRKLANDETGGEVSALLAEAVEKSLDVAGIEPLVSEDFYRVDIDATVPDLSATDWSLSITGAVAGTLSMTYDELTSLPSDDRFVTIRCVGDPLNGRQMDTALWTGTPIEELVDRVRTTSDCTCVRLWAADGYFQVFPLAAFRRGFLAYGMNGRPLPRAHGHPVRALIPGHWGEINVKWLTEVEFLNREMDGYWEKRGWHGTGPVNTVAKLHAENHFDDRIQVGGHAYAGTRGVQRVEVSTDGGATWNDATLSEPLPGEDVWRQWKYEYTPPKRQHEAVVRAIEADGTVQPQEQRRPFPTGATGWVRRPVRPGLSSLLDQ